MERRAELRRVQHVQHATRLSSAGAPLVTGEYLLVETIARYNRYRTKLMLVLTENSENDGTG